MSEQTEIVNAIIGLVLHQLCEAFPRPIDIDRKKIADRLQVTSKRRAWDGDDLYAFGDTPNGEPFQDVLSCALDWLKDEEVIRMIEGDQRRGLVLTSKAVSIMNIVTNDNLHALSLGRRISSAVNIFDHDEHRAEIGRVALQIIQRLGSPVTDLRATLRTSPPST